MGTVDKGKKEQGQSKDDNRRGQKRLGEVSYRCWAVRGLGKLNIDK